MPASKTNSAACPTCHGSGQVGKMFSCVCTHCSGTGWAVPNRLANLPGGHVGNKSYEGRNKDVWAEHRRWLDGRQPEHDMTEASEIARLTRLLAEHDALRATLVARCNEAASELDARAATIKNLRAAVDSETAMNDGLRSKWRGGTILLLQAIIIIVLTVTIYRH